MSAELREHYELVRRQRDDLMRLQLQKERLTAFVVHDLKNPVNVMDLHAQLMLRDPDVPRHAKESAQQIRDEARSLFDILQARGRGTRRQHLGRGRKARHHLL